MAATQAQLLGLTDGKEDTMAMRAVNTLFFCAIVIEIISVMVVCCSINWLEYMQDAEQGEFLEQILRRKFPSESEPQTPPADSVKVTDDTLWTPFRVKVTRWQGEK